MPVATRSFVRSMASAAAAPQPAPQAPPKKRKASSTVSVNSNKRPRNGAGEKETRLLTSTTDAGPSSLSTISNSLVPAVLSFDFELAKSHLISVDQRFQDLFLKMQCKPFEHLEQLDPFRALATSILGQQISWLAARSITHRFIRLYHPSIPEKPDHESMKSYLNLFPTPQDVLNTDLAALRTAGLSARKAEYVKDLASRFVDRRLSTEMLLNADDDDLYKMLIEVRGVGRWTVDMFAIFSLRRPDILPVGDLGVQRGLVRWFLSLHSPTHLFSLSPEKVSNQGKSTKATLSPRAPESDDVLPEVVDTAHISTASESAIDVGTGDRPEDEDIGLPAVPSPFTPSIHKTLNHSTTSEEPTPLPEGITVALLKSRLEGKKKIKGAFLTPQEMAELTECWKPYRSLGVYYMWSLAAAE